MILSILDTIVSLLAIQMNIGHELNPLYGLLDGEFWFCKVCAVFVVVWISVLLSFHPERRKWIFYGLFASDVIMVVVVVWNIIQVVLAGL